MGTPIEKVMRDYTVKENVVRVGPSVWWAALGLAAAVVALIGVVFVDRRLPEPLTRVTASPESFMAQVAHEHLTNLTELGPRVAGSYENEVLAVRVLVEAARRIAADVSPHNRIDIDVHTASGAFTLDFLDGMNNVYRDVQSVVGRVYGAGARPGREALLLNCHFDSVPDSPGASDDAAGCAVVLEVVRALAAARRPLRHDVLFLLNGAEENILQASHAFVTNHRWAAAARAFINVEAMGAGGREVLFRAGPGGPRLVEAYAAAALHPFGSSLAQEIFESGLIPADTDFRIFRDFGKLSGVDFAWSANGYVYHTQLDTAERVPLASLQRTGDNVLALARLLLDGERLSGESTEDVQPPVFFDILGLWVVCVQMPTAIVVVCFALTLAALTLRAQAFAAQRHLYMRCSEWYSLVARESFAWGAANVCGVACAAAVGLVLHTSGSRLAYYARPWLLVPLFAAPALCGCWAAGAAFGYSRRCPLVRGWWRARCSAGATLMSWSFVLLLCAVLRLRSGFVPLLWSLLPAGTTLRTTANGPRWAAQWAAGTALPALQTLYLAFSSLQMLVPMMGRSGTPPVPPDVFLGVTVAALTLAACSWLQPFVAAARNPRPLVWALGAAAVATLVGAAMQPTAGAYGPVTPQRAMIFHVRRTEYTPTGPPAVSVSYWIPELDANTPATLHPYVGATAEWSGEECERHPYCGAPYFLPALRLVQRWHMAPTPEPPFVELEVRAARRHLEPNLEALFVNVSGAAHVVLVVAPAADAHLAWSNVLATPLEGPRWRGRNTYFFALHDARVRPWRLELHVRGAPPDGECAALSAAGHAMFGPAKLAPTHALLLRSLPAWMAPTGWGVDLHLLRL